MGKMIASRISGMNKRTKGSLVVILTLLFSMFMYQGWLRPIISSSALNQMYYFTLDTGGAVNVGADGSTRTTYSTTVGLNPAMYSLAKTAFTGSTSYTSDTPASVKTEVATLYSPAYTSTQVLTNPYVNLAVRGGATGNITWYADIYDYDPAGSAGNGTLLWSSTGTDTWSGTTTTNRVLTFSSPGQQTIASGHRLKVVISANSASVQARLYFYSTASLYSYFRVDETNPNTDSVGNLADYNAGSLTSVLQGQNNVAMLKFTLQSNMTGGDTWTGGKLDKIGTNANLGDIIVNIYKDSNSDGVFDPLNDQRISNDITFTQATGMGYSLSVPQAVTSTQQRYFVVMSVGASATTATTVGLRIVDNTYFTMATGPVNAITSTSSSQPTINASGAALQKTYMADWDTGTTLLNPEAGGPTATNSTCVTANTTAAAGASLVGLLNFPSHTCTSTTTAYYQTNSADTSGNPKFVTLYFNGPQGYATDMASVRGISMKLRATLSGISTTNTLTVTYTLFYVRPDGTRVNAPISSTQTISAATNTAFSLAGQNFTTVPAGSRMGIQIGVNKALSRITLGSAAATQLVLEETAATSNGVDLNDGRLITNANVYGGSTGNVVDAFTLISPSGSQTVTGLTVTGNTTTNATNVAAVKIYRDSGSTPGVLDGGDTLVGTGTFSGNTAVITGMSETVTTSQQEYLVVYDISTTPVVGQVLNGVVTALSGVTTDVLSDTSSAKLTIAATTTVTNGAGEPANSVVASGGAAANLDSFGLKIDGGANDTINTVTVTLAPAGISAKVALVEIVDRGTGTVYGSISAPTSGDDWRVSTSGLQATTGTTECYARITPKNNVTSTHAVTGVVTSFTHVLTGNAMVVSDTASGTVTFDGQAPTDPVISAVSGTNPGEIALSWTAASDASGLNPTTAYKVVRGADNSPAPNDCSSGTIVYQGNGLNTTDSGLTPGYNYSYRACAVDVVNNTSAGTIASAEARQASVCNNTPSVSVTPVSQYVRAGAQAQYTINITNNDTGACGNTTFNLSIIGSENSTDFVTPSTFSPASVSLAANGGGQNVILYVTAKQSAVANASNAFTVRVAGAGHPSVDTALIDTTVNPFGPMLHTSVNVGTKYGVWGTNFTCGTCHTYNGTTNIKKISQTVATPTGNRSVTFTNISAAASVTAGIFGNDTRPSTTDSTNICEVCHHQTRFHQYSTSKLSNLGHNNSRDCMKCHPHGKGFKYSGGAGCTDCHGYPPTSSTNMAAPPTNALGLNPPTYGAHATHNSASMGCYTCHAGYTLNPMGNNIIEMGFQVNNTNYPGFNGSVNGGTFTGNANINTFYRWTSSTGTAINKVNGVTSCSVYCHGWSGSNGTNPNPSWVGVNQAQCGTCHGATGANPPASGSHTKHASTAVGNNGIACTKCHGTYTNYSTSAHVNGSVEWNLAAVSGSASYKLANSGGTGAQAPTSPASYGTCSTVYCHSDVQGPTGAGNPQNYATPRWGDSTTATCGSCHRNMYNDPNAPGGHVQHAQNADTSFDCRICHGTGGDANPQNHANGTIDMAFQGYGTNTVYSKGSHAPGTAYGTCSASNCHGRQTKTWGPSTATPLCEKCHGSADTAAFYSTAGTGTTSTSDQHVGMHAQHLKAAPYAYAGKYDCDACHLKPSEPYAPGHLDSALPAEVPFGTLASVRGQTPSYNSGNGQCTNVACHGAGMDSNAGTGNYVSVVLDGGSLGSPYTPTWNATFLTGSAASDCTKCHSYPPSAPNAGYTHYGKTPTDCNSCHNHVNTNGTGFVNYSAQMRHVNGTVDGGCTSCHGNPPINATSGGPTGLVTPALNALTPGNAGGHNAHLLNPSIGNNCSTCHNGYSTQMPSNNLQMGFNAYGGKITTGTFYGYSSLTNNVYVSSSSGTTVRRTSVAADQNTCSVYCHGAGGNGKPALGGGGIAKPDWELGSAEVACGNCHGVSTTSAPTAGSHSKHALSSGGGLGLACDLCHGAKVNNYHVNGSVEWHLKTSDARFGANATYRNLSSGATGNIAPSATFGTCANVYCHGAGTPTWGGSLADVTECDSCHGGNAASTATAGLGPIATGKHAAHINNSDANLGRFACGRCHASTVTTPNDRSVTGAVHANTTKDVAFDSLNPSGTAATCASLYCHSNGKGLYMNQDRATTWAGATTLNCKGCHGSDPNGGSFASVAGEPNYSNQGAGLANANSHLKHVATAGATACQNCHSTTSTNGTSITGTAHIDGTRTLAAGNGKAFTWTSGTKNCSNISCHFNGTAQWGASLTCTSCHGNNAASGTPMTTNRHTAHINNAAVIGTNFGCAECHAKTVSNDTTISAAANHANGFVDFSGVRAGKSTNYSSATGQCSATYCHTDGKGLQKIAAANNWKSGATLDCKGCHGSDPNGGSFASAAGEPNYSNAGTGALRANSHLKHVGAGGATTCGNCHSTTTTNGTAILANTNHLSGTRTLAAGNGKAFTWTAGTATCSNISCHSNGTARWGATLTCTSCHGNNATSGAPITTNRHTSHINNAAVIGTNLGCTECHAKTVSNDTTISGVNNHGNGFVDFSGVRAGKSTTYSSATGLCSATYCHTDGKGTQKMVAANNWKSGATLNCFGCHGSDANAGSFVSLYGEPNYSNAGSGVLRSNSHQKHVGTNPATICGNCHANTTTNGTSITGSAHVGGSISLVAGNGKTFSWTAATKTCSANGCHGNAVWGGTLGCVDCHNTSTIVRTQGRPGVTLSNVVAEFNNTWSHKRSASGVVTNADCIVCHLEGDSATQKTSLKHQDGNIDLRDPDGASTEAAVTNISGGAFTFARFTTTYVAGTRTTSGHTSNNIDNVITQKFCLKCHDANGATNTGARVGGAATSQYKPFNTTITGSAYVTPLSAGVAGGVVDVDTQFATTNSSVHPVKGPGYNYYASGTRMKAPYGVTKSGGPNASVPGVVLSCFDCHNAVGTPLTTRTVTAHGNAVTLRGTSVVPTATSAPSTTNAVTLCSVCHDLYSNLASTTNYSHGTGSAFSSNTGRSAKLPYLQYGCNMCHSSGYNTQAVRPIRGQEVHGVNTLPTSGRALTGYWSTNGKPYAFIRNRAFFSNHQPANVGGTSVTSTDGSGPGCNMNGTDGTGGACSNQGFKTYTPGGWY